jgi:SET domain-containing protein
MTKKVAVKSSKISGQGIFATQPFKKDDLVIKWSPHKTLSKQEADTLPEKEKEHVSYIDNTYVLVPSDGWVNHSCNPNVYLKNYCYLAKRDIKTDEEITTDYKLESEPGFWMKCNCGSRKCKGYISAP